MGKAARNLGREQRRLDVETARLDRAADALAADDPLERMRNAPTRLARLHAITGVRLFLDEVQAGLVEDARAEGVPWAVLGRAMGVTGQAASKRYGGSGAAS
jgi:hypothetical protein